MVPTYTNYWVSNRISECPILKFYLMDTSNNALSNPSITILNPDVAADSKLKVVNDAHFTTSVNIRGYTLSRNNHITLSIRVCGAENVIRASSSRRFYIQGFVPGDPASLSDSDRYFTIEQNTFASFFSLSPSSDPCTIKQYQIW